MSERNSRLGKRSQPGLPILERFWAKVGPPTAAGCREWTCGRYENRGGYGRFVISTGRQVTASRFAWEITNGPIPGGLCVCHECDNPPCCEPEHLFLGTRAQNTADMDAKGRRIAKALRGEHSPNAKVTVEQVRAIRAAKGSHPRIAAIYGVSPSTIRAIRHRQNWAWLA